MQALQVISGLLLVAAGIAACAMTSLAPPAALCPEPRRYTQVQERAAAAELRALPPDSEIAAMIADYGRERAELRACRGDGR